MRKSNNKQPTLKDIRDAIKILDDAPCPRNNRVLRLTEEEFEALKKFEKKHNIGVMK